MTSSCEVDELSTFNARTATNGSIAGSYTGDTDPTKVHSEGAGLNWEHAKLAYPSATVPLHGFIVTGSGSMIFGEARIDLDDHRIRTNGTDLQPSGFTVTQKWALPWSGARIAR